MQQDQKYENLKNKYAARQPRQELLDLIYKSRRTQRVLHGKIRSDIKTRIRVYSVSTASFILTHIMANTTISLIPNVYKFCY